MILDIKPFKLYNNSNLCYLNCIIQSLVCCYPLKDYISKLKELNKLQLIFKKLFNNSFFIENSGIEILLFLKEHNINVNLNQQDLIEYLFIVLHFLIGDDGIENICSFNYKCFINCYNCNDKKNNIYKLPDDNMNVISIPSNTLFIDEYINKHLEKITDYKCKFCNSNNIEYYKVLNKHSSILFILLSKNNSYKKNIEITIKKNKYNYKLSSIINYFGEDNDGHYNCISLRNKYEYYKFDDEFYEKIDYLQSNIYNYMLVYVLE